MLIVCFAVARLWSFIPKIRPQPRERWVSCLVKLYPNWNAQGEGEMQKKKGICWGNFPFSIKGLFFSIYVMKVSLEASSCRWKPVKPLKGIRGILGCVCKVVSYQMEDTSQTTHIEDKPYLDPLIISMINLEFGLFGMHLLDLYHVNLGTGPLGPNFQCQDWSMAQTDGSIWMDLVDQMFL